MGPLTCDGCKAEKVHRLVDGRGACSSCNAWRIECEARDVLKMASLQQRRAYIRHVLDKRGLGERIALENAIYAVWAIRDNKKA